MMYPVFALGLLAVATGGRFAWRGERQLLGFLYWLLAALLAAGAFGFTIEMMRVLSAVRASDEHVLAERLLMAGTTEAANVPAAALMFTTFVCLLVATGYRRFPQPHPGAPPR